MIDFPSSPSVGQIFNSGTGPIYVWDGVAWSLISTTPTAGETIVNLSGTAVDVTGIPPGMTRLEVMFDGSWSTSTIGVIQLGTSAGLVTTGYDSFASTLGVSTVVGLAGSSNYIMHGSAGIISNYRHAATFLKQTGNQWLGKGQGINGPNTGSSAFTRVVLPDVLDRIRITTGTGAATLSGTATVRWSPS